MKKEEDQDITKFQKETTTKLTVINIEMLLFYLTYSSG